jgi:16S rRNA (uracil1498-N3)-methyltransferase
VTPRLYVADLPVETGAGTSIVLPPAVAHHAMRVLRRARGDPVELFDGTGRSASAVVVEPRTGRCEIVRPLPDEPAPALSIGLVQCISSAEKMDWTIEKAVELGVDTIVPVQSARGIVRLDDARAARRHQHWQRLIEAACAQCGRNRLPILMAPTPLTAWLATPMPAGSWRLCLDPTAGPSLPAWLAEAHAPAAPPALWLACGPEAGFDADEMRRLAQSGWAGVRLGPRVLRTETAAMTAIAIIQGWMGDLR